MNVLTKLLKSALFFTALILTLSIAAIGVWETAKALLEYAGLLGSYHQAEHEAVITGILKGLEIIFLSPMPLLLTFAIRDLIYTYQADQSIKHLDDIAFAHDKLLKLKGVIIGLMATALAAVLLEKSFAHTASLEALAPHLVLMVLLITYSFVIGRHR